MNNNKIKKYWHGNKKWYNKILKIADLKDSKIVGKKIFSIDIDTKIISYIA